MIKVALADDEALFLKGMVSLLSDYEDLQIILEADDGENLLQKLRASNSLPDVLLLDMNMPKMNGVEAAKILQIEFPSVKIIVISSYFSKAFIVNMIELGASAYLPKNSKLDEVVATIREVFKNGFSYNQTVMEVIRENMIQKNKPDTQTPFVKEITPREREVLQLICEEFTTPEIAERLFISASMVDNHRNQLLEKLGCKNVAGLVVYAIQHQIVVPKQELSLFKQQPDNALPTTNTAVQTADATLLSTDNQLLTPDKEWLAALEKNVREHIQDEHLSVDSLAELMFTSRAQFYRRLEALTGLTPFTYIQNIRFNHARSLLEQRKVSSVKAAALSIAFHKTQRFSEHFKERFGKLPSEYFA